jgi:hypothetical protein
VVGERRVGWRCPIGEPEEGQLGLDAQDLAEGQLRTDGSMNAETVFALLRVNEGVRKPELAVKRGRICLGNAAARGKKRDGATHRDKSQAFRELRLMTCAHRSRNGRTGRRLRRGAPLGGLERGEEADALPPFLTHFAREMGLGRPDVSTLSALRPRR